MGHGTWDMAWLRYLHGQGILHRDVKSANVLVDVDASGGLSAVKLSDFGLAKGGAAAGVEAVNWGGSPWWGQPGFHGDIGA